VFWRLFVGRLREEFAGWLWVVPQAEAAYQSVSVARNNCDFLTKPPSPLSVIQFVVLEVAVVPSCFFFKQT
jgi:hypothetical protein